MKRLVIAAVAAVCLLSYSTPAAAQSFPTNDPVIKAIWAEGMENSQFYSIAQVLLDSIGPRLTGSPQLRGANDWAVAMFQRWGVTARNEQYGTWRGWRRGISHVDMISPWVRSLEATMLAWSPGTRGKVEGPAVVIPEFTSAAEFAQWLPNARDKFVLVSFLEPTCRPDDNWEEYATEESFEAMRTARNEARQAWNQMIRGVGGNDSLYNKLEGAGARGILTSSWPGGWGVQRVFGTTTERVPTFGVNCEDYGLVYRLAKHNQGPVLRVEAEAEFLGEVPMFNTIAEIRGSEKPDEYVLLSAHFDSWDGGQGAVDNATGSVTMMETIRILKQVYPNPKRTIMVGLWGAEEQGLIGSRAFSEDHPEVVANLQALFNQDNGTGRVVRISMQGLTGAAEHFGRWIAQIPNEITRHIDLQIPGTPGGGGSDYASFICHGAPSFSLSSNSWGYSPYTWHTQRDTFDKIVWDEVKNNATLTAMLVYLASEDPEMVARDRIENMVNPRTGAPMEWPTCRPARRSYEP